MKSFDVVLILGYFRSATAFLSIVRHLAPTLRIGILPAQVEAAHLKTPRAQQLFLELCSRFGAEIVEQGTPIEAQLLIVQQFPYPEDTVATIRASVAARRVVALMGLTVAGLAQYDAFLAAFDIKRGLVPNRRLFRFLMERRNAEDVYRHIELEQVGLPFRRYPVFPEFEADYLIAAPTVFSFRRESDKHTFLANVLRLLEQIPPDATVVYKSHNGAAQDYFAPPFYIALAAILERIPFIRAAAPRAATWMPKSLRTHVDKLYTALLHTRVLRRVVPMSAATPYAEISLEAFLPHVRHGVIGGLSNTIWGTLYFGLPYFNCVDAEQRLLVAAELMPHRDASKLLDLNLAFFGVPYCGGDLQRGANGDGVIMEQDLEGDLVEAVLTEYEKADETSRVASPAPSGFHSSD